MGLGETRRAAENFQIADALGGSTNASLNLLADIYSTDGLYDLAVRAYLAAFEKDPDATPDRALKSAGIMIQRGAVDPSNDLVDGIIAHFGDGLDDASRAKLQKLQAKIAVRNGDSEAEIAILEQIATDNPLDGDAYILLGEALERADRLEDAYLQFETAARIDGFEGPAKLKHAQALVRAKRYDEAVPLLKSSLQYDDKPSVREFLEGVEKAAARSRKSSPGT
jgi:tetratricopeptide (TPR) repeat protein